MSTSNNIKFKTLKYNIKTLSISPILNNCINI